MALLLVIFAASILPGCIFPELERRTTPGLPQTSPDGATKGSVWIDQLRLWTNIAHYRVLGQTAYVGWWPTTEGEELTKVRLAGWWLSGEPLVGKLAIAFSPDSRHLAVRMPSCLKVIELKTSRCWTLTPWDEMITSLKWTSQDEIVYAAHTEIRDVKTGPAISRRTFWRQKIHQSPQQRRMVHTIAPEETGAHLYFWSLESISPRGRWAIFERWEESGRFYELLDFGSGEAQRLPIPGAGDCPVRWKDNGALALCTIFSPSRSGYAYYLVDPAARHTEDVTERGKSMSLLERWAHFLGFQIPALPPEPPEPVVTRPIAEVPVTPPLK